MPSIRFSCEQWFETTLESPQVPRIGERVVLSEHGLKVNYRVSDVIWHLADSAEHGGVELDVKREPANPCTKCRKFSWKLEQVLEAELALSPATIGWECDACEYERRHGKPKPAPVRLPEAEASKHHY